MTYLLTRWLFLRLLGVVYLVAFVSLAFEIKGLVGSNGILPVADFLEAIYSSYGADAYRQFPTLVWLNTSDTFLQWLCWGGAVAALLVIIGLLNAPLLAVCWLFYLSLTIAGQIFLGYQWDALLLETGFIAIFFAPWQLLSRLSKQIEPPWLVLWLLRLLLFRLMFGSGAVKLLSGDPHWADLTALSYHWYTQPLPTPLAWYAHQLPLWFHQLSTLVTFIVELVVPFLIFVPWRRVRFLGAAAIIGFQILILLTGNYTFFNWLAIALCVLLLDDDFLRRWLPLRLTHMVSAEKRLLPRWRQITVLPLALILLMLGAVQVGSLFGLLRGFPRPVVDVLSLASRFRIINGYGLFAVMTTSRLEIVVEGSNDNQTWLPYEFRYKPGDVNRPPPWIAPFQPRLDWQMWFAALGNVGQNPWFTHFMERLLQGSPDVLALLQTNPFPEAPPRYIRARLYEYTFTDWAARVETGAWWSAAPVGDYFPEPFLR